MRTRQHPRRGRGHSLLIIICSKQEPPPWRIWSINRLTHGNNTPRLSLHDGRDGTSLTAWPLELLCIPYCERVYALSSAIVTRVGRTWLRCAQISAAAPRWAQIGAG